MYWHGRAMYWRGQAMYWKGRADFWRGEAYKWKGRADYLETLRRPYKNTVQLREGGGHVEWRLRTLPGPWVARIDREYFARRNPDGFDFPLEFEHRVPFRYDKKVVWDNKHPDGWFETMPTFDTPGLLPWDIGLPEWLELGEIAHWAGELIEAVKTGGMGQFPFLIEMCDPPTPLCEGYGDPTPPA
jgi:hypothetical protein